MALPANGESAESARPVPGSAVLGPMRLGSQWLMATRMPVVPATARATRPDAGLGGSLRGPGRVDFRRATSARLTDTGYDFELSQVEPRSARSRIFVELQHGAAERCGRGTGSACRSAARDSRKLPAGCDPPARRLVSGHAARLGNRPAGVPGVAARRSELTI